MPTVRPLAEWPELLSGPILRRVTPRSVAVFAAFKSAGTVELSVGVKGSTATRPTATAPTLSLGDNLHVCVVEYVAPTTTAFTPGVTYEYQLRYQAAGSTAWKS